MENRIIVMGPLINDYHYVAETYPGEGQLSTVTDSWKMPGGVCPLLASIVQLDASSPLQIWGTIGQDTEGKKLKAWLRDNVPPLSFDGLVEQGESGYAVHIETKDDGILTLFTFPGSAVCLDVDSFPWNKAKGALFFIDYCRMASLLNGQWSGFDDHVAEVLRKARQQGARTMINLGASCGKKVGKEVFRDVDICVVDDRSTAALPLSFVPRHEEVGDRRILQKMFQKIQGMGVATAVLFHEPGCWHVYTCEQQEIVDLPLVEDKVEKGAEAAFLPGVMVSIHRGLSILESVRFGIMEMELHPQPVEASTKEMS